MPINFWLAALGAICGGAALFIAVHTVVVPGGKGNERPLLLSLLAGFALVNLVVLLNPGGARGIAAAVASGTTYSPGATEMPTASLSGDKQIGSETLAPRPARRVTKADIERLNGYLNGVPQQNPARMSVSPDQTQSPLPDVETMIGKLVARLESDPRDIDGWRMLGWSYRHTDRPALAVEAYQRAVKLAPDRQDLADALREARSAASPAVPSQPTERN